MLKNTKILLKIAKKSRAARARMNFEIGELIGASAA